MIEAESGILVHLLESRENTAHFIILDECDKGVE